MSLDGPKKKTPEQQAVHVLAKNLVMVAAVYLAVWGATCMTLATAALPRTKKMVAGLNLVAATVTATEAATEEATVATTSARVRAPSSKRRSSRLRLRPTAAAA